MQRMTRKGIEEIARSLDAVKLTGKSIYTFEDSEYRIRRLQKGDDKDLNAVIDMVLESFPKTKGVWTEEIAYSAGVYGCNGKISAVKTYDEAWNNLGIACFVYF